MILSWSVFETPTPICMTLDKLIPMVLNLNMPSDGRVFFLMTPGMIRKITGCEKFDISDIKYYRSKDIDDLILRTDKDTIIGWFNDHAVYVNYEDVTENHNLLMFHEDKDGMREPLFEVVLK